MTTVDRTLWTKSQTVRHINHLQTTFNTGNQAWMEGFPMSLVWFKYVWKCWTGLKFHLTLCSKAVQFVCKMRAAWKRFGMNFVLLFLFYFLVSLQPKPKVQVKMRWPSCMEYTTTHHQWLVARKRAIHLVCCQLHIRISTYAATLTHSFMTIYLNSKLII